MYYNLYEIRIKDYWNSIDTITFYKTAENFKELAEKIKDIEEAFSIEIKSIREIEDFDHSNKRNLYKVRIAPNDCYDFDTFTTAEDYVEAAKWVKETWESEDVKIESIQEVASFNKF